MAVSVPPWLTLHDGNLRAGPDGSTWFVCFRGEPQYRLAPVPVASTFGCQVVQTNNGRRLDSGAAFPSLDAALQGGLEDLRKVLGW